MNRYGSFEKLSQFAVDIVKKVGERVSENFPIAFRFFQWKQQDYGARLVYTPDCPSDWQQSWVNSHSVVVCF